MDTRLKANRGVEQRKAGEIDTYASIEVVPPGPTPTLEQDMATNWSCDGGRAILGERNCNKTNELRKRYRDKGGMLEL